MKESENSDEVNARQESSCIFVREVLSLVGDKWSVLLIALLGDSTRRFNEMKRMVDGISQRMLTLTLRGLERDGLVKRAVYPTVPPRVEYALTPLGKKLLKTVKEMASWAVVNRKDIERARAEFDCRETETDTPLKRHA